MSLYDVAKTRMRVGSSSMLSHVFAVVEDVIVELTKEGVLSELLYVMKSETGKELKKDLRWTEAFENKGLKVNFGKAKIMVCGGITKDGLSKSIVAHVGSAGGE